MTDLLITDGGDILPSHSGDFELTATPWRDDLQQAYVRCMTDEGDFLLYPELGATLSKLYGMPQSSATGAYGEGLIKASLEREGRFVGMPIKVKAVPISATTIRFDITIISGSRQQVKLSIDQSLVPES